MDGHRSQYRDSTMACTTVALFSWASFGNRALRQRRDWNLEDC